MAPVPGTVPVVMRISSSARPRVLSSIAGLLVPLTLVVGGCSSNPPLSPAEYRRAVGAVCRSTAATIAALPPPDPLHVDRMIRVGRRSVARQRDSLRQIQALDAPTQDERHVAHWLDLVGRVLDASAASLRAQSIADLTAAGRANAKGAALSSRADVAARSLHLSSCATPLPPVAPAGS